MIERITVLGTEDAKRMFDEIGRQAPFALANTLNDLATRSQKAVQDSLSDNFTLRRADFVRKTIYRKTGEDWASKTKLQAGIRVNEERNFLAKFEDGGVNRAREGKYLAVPVDVRRTKKDLISDANKPAALLKKPRIRIANRAIVQSIGRASNAIKRVLYVFIREARIDKRLGMATTSRRVVEQDFDSVAEKHIEHALRTAR